MAQKTSQNLYHTDAPLKKTVQVGYPAGHGRIVLRTELDWHRDVEPIAVSDDGTMSTFEVAASQPYLYFKVGLIQGDSFHWSRGPNNLLLLGTLDLRMVYPFFFGEENGRFSELIEIPSKILGRAHRLRVYLPPGYDENTLATYPVAYMQDGQNLFFPVEAFMGNDWEVDDTSQTLRSMRAVDDFIFVGLHSADRMQEYTKPGYETYARAVVEDVIPRERQVLRGMGHRRARSMWGSSLGGVVSFYTVWQHADVFGAAVCMSSTFSHKDDLIERVLAEPTPNVGFYLDSGWPGDNYEVTLSMAMALITRGWRYGHNLFHLCVPQAGHNEKAWGGRLHVPLQFLNGAVARASRSLTPELNDRP